MFERILDMAAAELGMDPVEIRRRNFLQPDEFPYTTVTGVTYDIGDYDAALTEALRIAGYEELRAEQAARRARGDVKQLGIGICAYVEITAGGSGSEYAEVEVHPDGSATVKAGTSAHGQGHATAYAQFVSGELGIPIEKIAFVQSDTALVPRGGGTGGSRSLQLGGSAALEASRAVLERARSLAAEMLEAAPRRHRAHRRRHARRRRRAVEGDHVGRARDQGDRGRSSARSPSTTSCNKARRSRSARTCRWSRSTPRPDGSSRSATSRSTTAVGSSTRCSSTARCTAGWRRGSRRRCGRRSSTTTTATR